MRIMTFAFVVLAAACSKKEKPAGGAGSASGSATAPGSGSGSADSMMGSGSGSAEGSGSAAAACAPVSIKLAKDGATVKRDKEEKVALDALEPALAALAKACVGELNVSASDDTSYQMIIDAMDRGKKVGFEKIALEDGASKSGAPASTGSGPPDIANAPLVIVTAKDVTLVVGKAERVKVSDLGEFDAADLDIALKKVPTPKQPGVLIVQADAATSAKVINTIVASGKKAGWNDVLFAVKNR